MRPLILSLILIGVAVLPLSAQKLIVRQSSGTPHFYTKLDDAITEAVSNDTIYLPDGYFDLNVSIDKKLHFIGVGHHPQNAGASGITYIGGSRDFEMTDVSDGSTCQGLYLYNGFTLFEGVTNLFISRCNVNTLSRSSDVFVENITFSECVFRSSIFCPMQYCQFNNCIFQDYFYMNYRNCNFSNSIFLSGGFPMSGGGYQIPAGIAEYCDFSNNVFCTLEGLRNVGICTFRNNVFGGLPVFDGVNLVGSGNKTEVLQSAVFVRQTDHVFSYDNNYQMAIEEYNTAGTGGTAIGIYGGLSPWKDSTTPSNPVIESKGISGTTNADGTLNVQIKVSAQQR